MLAMEATTLAQILAHCVQQGPVQVLIKLYAMPLVEMGSDTLLRNEMMAIQMIMMVAL